MNLLLRFLLLFLVLSVVGTFVQTALVTQKLFFPAWKVYVFHFVASSVLSYAVFMVSRISFQSTGFAFVGGGLVKMILSVVFLSPLIFSDNTHYIPDVIAFFIPYFVFLGAEVVFAMRLLASK